MSVANARSYHQSIASCTVCCYLHPLKDIVLTDSSPLCQVTVMKMWYLSVIHYVYIWLCTESMCLTWQYILFHCHCHCHILDDNCNEFYDFWFPIVKSCSGDQNDIRTVPASVAWKRCFENWPCGYACVYMVYAIYGYPKYNGVPMWSEEISLWFVFDMDQVDNQHWLLLKIQSNCHDVSLQKQLFDI